MLQKMMTLTIKGVFGSTLRTEVTGARIGRNVNLKPRNSDELVIDKCALERDKLTCAEIR